MYTIRKCKDAIHACDELAKTSAGHARRLWQERADYWRSQLRDAEKEALKDIMSSKPDTCPAPQSLGSDEYRCAQCNRVWSRTEERPDCALYSSNA